MATATGKAHLTPEVLRRHGATDLCLVLGSTAFPVHRAYICGCSGVLSSLAGQFEGQQEICLLRSSSNSIAAGDGTASQVPEAVRSEEHFQLFLQLMYRQAAAIKSEGQALALVAMADYWDSPAVLPAVDAYLAAAVYAGHAGVSAYTAPTDNGMEAEDKRYTYTHGGPSGKLQQFLELASMHKLRRLMAACLPLVWGMSKPKSASVFRQLDSIVLAELLVVMQNGFDVKYGCDDHQGCEGERHSICLPAACASGPCCEQCMHRQELTWRKAAEELERGLAEAGWGMV